jgi:hypothetical protein
MQARLAVARQPGKDLVLNLNTNHQSTGEARFWRSGAGRDCAYPDTVKMEMKHGIEMKSE